MKTDYSGTKSSDDFKQKYKTPPKGSKSKVKGYRRQLPLLECPWAQCNDYKEESSYRSAFKTFKNIRRTQMIRPTAHIMRDKESLRQSAFLRRQFDKKKECCEKGCAEVA